MSQDNAKSKPKLITPRVLHDQPLDRGRRPKDQAEFNFEDYANTFARLIAERATETPLVLGISGSWGSGKTTLLKLIQTKLDSTQDDNFSAWGFVNPDDENATFRRCRTVWFNAWKYADEDALLVALVRVIVQTMYADDLVSKSLAAIFDPIPDRRDVINTVLSWFSLKTPFGDFKPSAGTPEKTAFAEKAALLDQFSDAFDRLMAAWVHRKPDAGKVDPSQGVLVVFIDDLDRCLHDKAVQVLEAIKLFLDRPGVVFVLAADETMIEAAIRARFKTQEVEGQRARDYLEKFFQVRFLLPPISETQAGDYLAHALADVDEPLVRMVLAGAEVNPRQIKTFVNYLNVGWAVLNNSGQAQGVARADFARWLALTRVAPRFCDKVRELPKDRRLDYLADAAKWAADATHKAGEYQDWAGPDYRRLRNILKLGGFSDRVAAEVLEGFIFWSAPEVVPTARTDAGGAEKTVEVYEVTGFKAEPRAQSGREAPAGNWITIPAGKFVMGSREDDTGSYDDERPQHTFEIRYDYRIARFPVTNADFRTFADAAHYKTTAETQGSSRILNRQSGSWGDMEGADWRHPQGPESSLDGLDQHPVVHISWHDARVYCEWLTKALRQKAEIGAAEIVRLPTEAEWEKAARGEYGKVYPWGDEWDPARCNSTEKGPRTTTPVGQYSPQGDSPYGVADMAGNVWEWCQSKFKPYEYTPGDGREELTGDDRRVLRGGSFYSNRRRVRCASRLNPNPGGRFDTYGFRVVVVSPGSG